MCLLVLVAARAGELRLIEDDRAAARVPGASGFGREDGGIDRAQQGFEVLSLSGLDRGEERGDESRNQKVGLHAGAEGAGLSRSPL